MRLLPVLLAIPLAASSAVAALDCRADKPESSSYWSWRLVDGKRCWYQGKSGKDKADLHWVKTERVAPDKSHFVEALDGKSLDTTAPIVPAWVKTLRVLPAGIVELTPQQRIDADFNILFIDQAQYSGDVAGFLARLHEHGEHRWRDMERGRPQ